MMITWTNESHPLVVDSMLCIGEVDLSKVQLKDANQLVLEHALVQHLDHHILALNLVARHVTRLEEEMLSPVVAGVAVDQ